MSGASGPIHGNKSCKAEFDKEIDEAIEFAEKSPYPEPEEALDHVFSFSIRERELVRKTWEPQIPRRGAGDLEGNRHAVNDIYRCD